MGELVRETPISEIMATLEALDNLGVRRQHLTNLRSNTELRERVVITLIGSSVVEGSFFTFETRELTLNELRQQNPDRFSPYINQMQNIWWTNENFANKKGKARRISLRTTYAKESLFKRYREQRRLLGSDEFVPTVRDVADGMLQFYQATGQMLFEEIYLGLRCRDIGSDGLRVVVGVDTGCINLEGLDDNDFYEDGPSTAIARNL